ncbi:MAG: alanine:cation symporter family protein [Oscillospiraceae bacterium]
MKERPHAADTISAVIQALNRVVWGAPALLLILGGTGLRFSLSHPVSPKVQGSWAFLSVPSGTGCGKKPEAGSVSPFQAVCTALAATVGTGNIAGV